MRKNLIVIGAIAAVVFVAASGLWAAEKPKHRHPTRDFMQQKLAYNQGIVQGIVLEKYDLVLTNAASLRNMNLTNAYLALKNPNYIERIADFQQRVDSLADAAKGKDLEKATEAYSQVVNSCVACHKSFRLEQFQASFQK